MNVKYVTAFVLALFCSLVVIHSDTADAEKQDLTILDIRYDADAGYVVVVVDSDVDMMQFIVIIDGQVDPVAALGTYTGTENWILIYHTSPGTPEDFILKNVDEVFSDLSFTYTSYEPTEDPEDDGPVMMYVAIALIAVVILAAVIIVVRKYRR